MYTSKNEDMGIVKIIKYVNVSARCKACIYIHVGVMPSTNIYIYFV